ncbi:GDP-mannose mannosyl hydrolase [Comamonadaceae bacterium PP-2]
MQKKINESIAALSRDDFKKVVAATPLVSIDLLVRDPQGRLLVGLRNNAPAQGFWFVPGGRIRRHESIDAAFSRLTKMELGHNFSRSSAHFFGLYDHFYDEDFSGDSSLGGTHYVVLAHEILVPSVEALLLPTDQHSTYRWLTDKQLWTDSLVHPNTRAYSKTHAGV